MEKRNCHDCLYAHWDASRWLRTLPSGWPCGPICINHPDSPGEMREILAGGVCRNFRPRPRAPAQPPFAAGTARPGGAGGDACPASKPTDDIRRIPLTRGKFALVSAADYEWLSKHRWSCRGGGNPYAARFEHGKVVWMHREIMKTPPGMVCDHMDGNGLNNLPWNLRNCRHEDNVHNLSKAAHGTSIYKGVWRDKETGKYHAKICHRGRRYWLGTFVEEIDAARAYDHKAVELFGEFARLNLPDEWPPERRRQVHALWQNAVKQDSKPVSKQVKRNAGRRNKRKERKSRK
jgi:hypothetical protein